MDQPRTYLVSLLRSVDAWVLATAAGAAVLALLLALWLSWRVTRRLATLADKTAVIDLDRLDVEFDEGTDEVGRLSRVLGDLTARLHAGTARVREAERRATVGDLARQINHDIKNGLIPLRNVMRHLTQVGRDDPSALAAVLAERRGTIDSSIGYLETLATNYERLSGRPERRECDVHALIGDVARGAGIGSQIELRTDLSASDATVFGDPIAVRRILENLVTNAADSLAGRTGRISIATATVDRDDAPVLAITVADTGRGMTEQEAAMIFEHFYSTREGGGGLGLSIVRRLVTDLHGTIRVESEPGQGTRMIVEIPTVHARADARAAARTPSRRTSGARRRW
jgi:signal transduction histidine kinase